MMNLTEFQQKISVLLPEIKLFFNESLSRHTSFRIGGPVEVMAFPSSVKDLSQLIKASVLLDTKPAILGAGTNVLAPDEGMSGLVICLRDLDGIELLDSCRIRVSGGVTMTRAAVFAAGHGLSGLEFAHGIPGTVGGGVYMNAGAYGGEIGNICECVEILHPDGTCTVRTAQQMDFSYRHSCLEGTGDIVVSATFALQRKAEDEIRAYMQELMNRRKASQPLDRPSAGSAFKRPAGDYAAALIDRTGLKGYQIGGAAVSDKHAGFVVNLGDATAADVRAVLNQVSQKVFESTGIRLEPEIRIW